MAAASFALSLALVLQHEGGFVNHPKDPGGATNLGVTLATAKRLGIDVDGDGDTDIIDIRKLTREHAAIVYRAEYWNAVRGDELPVGVDYVTFDYAVNSGPGRAVKSLQRAAGVKADGVLGPASMRAISAKPPAELVRKVCDERMSFLKGLPTWPTFGKGWGRRVADVRAKGLAACV